MSIKSSVACIVRSSLVQETTLAISAIAAPMGYKAPTNLTAAFKKHFAVPPPRARRGGTRTRWVMRRGLDSQPGFSGSDLRLHWAARVARWVRWSICAQ